MKRWKNTLIVVAICIALAAYVLLFEVKREPPTDAQATPTPLPLLSLTVNEIKSLHMSAGERTLRIEHRQNEWRIVEPDEGIADPVEVHIAADDLARLTARQILLEQVAGREQYGLAPASLTLTVTTYTDAQVRLYIGRQTPDNMAYYVQLDGDPRLYLVNQYTLQPFFTWIDAPPYQPTPTPSQ